MKNKLALALLLAVSTTPVLGQGDSVSGTWKVSGDVMGNPVESVCTFKQEGKALSGSCKSPERDKPTDIKGEVSEKKVSWKFDTEYNGETLIVTFSGTLDAGQISGNIDIQPISVNGTFTAKKGDAK